MGNGDIIENRTMRKRGYIPFICTYDGIMGNNATRGMEDDIQRDV